MTTEARSVLDEIHGAGVVPLVTVSDLAIVDDLADAITAGGMRAIEVALRSSAGVEAVGRLARHGALLVGAGTVVAPEQVEEVAGAGARFVVSPGIDARVVEAAQERGMTPLPGTATATDVQTALRLGLDAVKLFPAALLGGLTMIEALRGPFPGMRFFASGGIRADDVEPYLANPGVLAVSGSWMVPTDLIAQGQWSRITDLCLRANAAAGER